MKTTCSSRLHGEYQEADQIILSWIYPEEERSKYKFELEHSINNGEFVLLSSSDEM
ncbi:hypothetical protein KHA80_01130 [Anaerobacillus sp. HL2]|nr:hypothetical protein KHA80_01130 [Anaerobacillus sp. HL2]